MPSKIQRHPAMICNSITVIDRDYRKSLETDSRDHKHQENKHLARKSFLQNVQWRSTRSCTTRMPSLNPQAEMQPGLKEFNEASPELESPSAGYHRPIRRSSDISLDSAQLAGCAAPHFMTDHPTLTCYRVDLSPSKWRIFNLLRLARSRIRPRGSNRVAPACLVCDVAR